MEMFKTYLVYFHMEMFKTYLVILTLLHCMNTSTSQTSPIQHPISGNETDRLALLMFKDCITYDPFGSLSSWNGSSYFCEWRGVTCSPRRGRVTVLDLRSLGLVGTISRYIGNLTFLQGINLRNNSFTGEIPQEVGRLHRLRHLNLTQNALQGEIPINLTSCSNLEFLDLVVNQLVGTIPSELGTLTKLVGLGLAGNHLTGTLPSSLSNLSSLARFSLSDNRLVGNIPRELGRLSKLEFLQFSSNLFTGTIPAQLFNISSIKYFFVTDNRFIGSIPSDVGLTLPSLKRIFLGMNELSGPIPASISNCSHAEILDFSNNTFSGPISTSLGALKSLVILQFGRNQLWVDKPGDLNMFFTSLANCTRLKVLDLTTNYLSAELPNSLANLSTQLTNLYMGENRISGNIPVGIGNLVGLASLTMEKNLLRGHIPVSIGNLQNLRQLYLSQNKFSGEIPPSVGNITLLNELNLDQNQLGGSIPSSLGNCQDLQLLSLSTNKLIGAIPKSVISLSSLSMFLDLSHNSLTGNLPPEVGSLKNIRSLNLSENKLSGEIPNTLENCLILGDLYLNGNFFEGTIPASLRALKGMQDLDLSHNNLSGQIPEYLQTFPYLKNLNLSFNNLEGEVPKEGIFKNSSAISIVGNKELCGGILELHLPRCSTGKRRRSRFPFKLVIPIAGSLICFTLFCLVASLLWRRRNGRSKPAAISVSDNKFLRVSYEDLFKATDGFSSANLIGVGSYGTVYKGILSQDGLVVAVKVLDLQRRGALKSFIAECEALRNIRHRNLIKILTSCSSTDFKGDEFKALVFEYMPNGNLDTWLHPTSDEFDEPMCLSFLERLNIAIDIANAIDYLHHHCHTPIVHCDVKPSNILLDDDMNGHVGDFGLARFLKEAFSSTSKNQTSSVGITGTIGYVPPEYGIGGEVWTTGDVYSYGILLLEMFTGKGPTNDMFGDGLSLHDCAKRALPDRVVEIIDPSLIQDEHMDKCLVKIVRVGVACSNELPRERIDMRRVVTELEAIKDTFVEVGAHGQG